MTPLFTVDELKAATTVVRTFVPQTPAYAWPLLRNRLGVEVIVKHENHTPTGSFKARSGIVYVDALRRHAPCQTAWLLRHAAITGNLLPSPLFEAVCPASLSSPKVTPLRKTPQWKHSVRSW
jgi:hypothetical protein